MREENNPEMKTLIDTLEEFNVKFVELIKLIFICAKINDDSIRLAPITKATYVTRNGVEITTLEPLFSDVKQLLFRSPDGKERLITLGIYGHVDFDYRPPYFIVIFGRREEYFPPENGIIHYERFSHPIFGNDDEC